jgi:hypothetical protein
LSGVVQDSRRTTSEDSAVICSSAILAMDEYTPSGSRKQVKGGEEEEFEFRGTLRNTDGRPLEIDGLWALSFGNDAAAGPANVLFFTAGPFDEQHGLFGELTPVPAPMHGH